MIALTIAFAVAFIGGYGLCLYHNREEREPQRMEYVDGKWRVIEPHLEIDMKKYKRFFNQTT